MKTSTLVTMACASLMAVTTASRARADDTARRRGLAEALFQEGRSRVEKGDLVVGCAKLAESQELDRQLGTLINLAGCHEAQGRLATAWAEFNEAHAWGARLNRPDRAELARARAAAIAPRLSHVVLVTNAAAPDFSVVVDGTPMGAGVLGTELPIDAGEHTILASGRGRRAWSGTFTIAANATAKVEIPVLESAASGAGSAELPAPAPAPSETRTSPLARTVPFVLAGVGVLGLGVGSYFGLRTFSLKSDADAECDGQTCTTRGLELDHRASDAAAVSTVAFSVGVLAVGAAVVLWLTAPRPSSTKAGTALPHALRPGGAISF